VPRPPFAVVLGCQHSRGVSGRVSSDIPLWKVLPHTRIECGRGLLCLHKGHTPLFQQDPICGVCKVSYTVLIRNWSCKYWYFQMSAQDKFYICCLPLCPAYLTSHLNCLHIPCLFLFLSGLILHKCSSLGFCG